MIAQEFVYFVLPNLELFPPRFGLVTIVGANADAARINSVNHHLKLARSEL